ncbi:hypothetical protein ACSVIJ_23785, partial [Pseudomonas sp. NCHU5208]|uniref:hypothetical protein n=1 Tax=unclassified Pseudomonas TaxID=196821 RepID=UPI003F95E422
FLLLTFLCALQRKVSRPRGRNPEYLKTPNAASGTPTQANTQTCQSGITQAVLQPGFQGSSEPQILSALQ